MGLLPFYISEHANLDFKIHSMQRSATVKPRVSLHLGGGDLLKLGSASARGIVWGHCFHETTVANAKQLKRKRKM
jgi:hypothetical protein